MRVVFFPSCLPFMGVILFPSFVLGNASGEGGASLVSFSPFSFFLSLPLLSSPSPSFSFSLSPFLLFFHISFSLFPFLPHKLFPSFFLLLLFSTSFLSFSFLFLFLLSSTYFHLVFLPSFLPEALSLFFFFFFEGTACTVCFQDVIVDADDCN